MTGVQNRNLFTKKSVRTRPVKKSETAVVVVEIGLKVLLSTHTINFLGVRSTPRWYFFRKIESFAHKYIFYAGLLVESFSPSA